MYKEVNSEWPIDMQDKYIKLHEYMVFIRLTYKLYDIPQVTLSCYNVTKEKQICNQKYTKSNLLLTVPGQMLYPITFYDVTTS